MAEIKPIRLRSEIPLGARYVLVMTGLSTHETVHAHGATFVVNDGLLNPQRSADRALALTKAQQFAGEHGLPTIYLLE